MRNRTQVVNAFWVAQHLVLGCLGIVPLGWFLTALSRRVNNDFGSRSVIVIRGRISPFAVPADQVNLMMIAGFCGVVFLGGVSVLISLMLNRWLTVPVTWRWVIGAVVGVVPFVIFWVFFTDPA